jgi:hypothetical protein
MTKLNQLDTIHFTCKLFEPTQKMTNLNDINCRSDSDEGGYGQKTQSVQSRQTIYAGVRFESDGYPQPTAAGRYCEWQIMTVDKSSEIESFEEYMKTLKLHCEPGESAYLNWTVSFDTPDLVYYQVMALLSFKLK